MKTEAAMDRRDAMVRRSQANYDLWHGMSLLWSQIDHLTGKKVDWNRAPARSRMVSIVNSQTAL